MNVLVIGESKTGKTFASATLPGKSVLLNRDPGGYQALTVPYKMMPPGSGMALCEALEETDFIVIDYTSIAAEISEAVGKGARAKASLETYRASVKDINALLLCDAVDNLIDDGLTGMQDTVLGAVLALNNRQRPVYEDWGQAIDKIMEIYSVLAAGKPNFVLATHIQIERDEFTGKVKETPLVFGKQLPNKLLALFDNVFQTGYSGGTYYWLTHPQPLMPTVGSRIYHNLPDAIHQNYAELFEGTSRDAKSKEGQRK